MKPLIIVVAVIVFVGVGAVYYINQPYSFLNLTPTVSDQVFDSGNPDPTLQTDQSFTDNYLEYSSQVFTSSRDKKRVLYFFADWCPECKEADADFKASSSKIPADIIIFRTNYRDTQTNDEEERLAVKYKITYQHTFVQVDENGNEITKWNGGGLDNLLSKIK